MEIAAKLEMETITCWFLSFRPECEVPHSMWVTERRMLAKRSQEDLVYVECTPKYPISSVFHHCVWVKVGPELLSMRVLGAGLNQQTLHGWDLQHRLALLRTLSAAFIVPLCTQVTSFAWLLRTNASLRCASWLASSETM